MTTGVQFIHGERDHLPPYSFEILPGHSSQTPQSATFPPLPFGGHHTSAAGLIHEAQLPSSPRQANKILLNRKNASVKGTYVINPFLRTISLLQPYVGENNFQAIVDGGIIDVDLWLTGDKLSPGNGVHDSGDAKALISLELMNSREDLVAKLHRPMSTFPPFQLKAKSSTRDSVVAIHLPRSFRGSIKVTGPGNLTTFSEALNNEIASLSEKDGLILCFVGEIPEGHGDFTGDQVEVHAQNASIVVQYVDGEPGIDNAIQPSSAHLLECLAETSQVENPNFSMHQAQQTNLALASFERIGKGAVADGPGYSMSGGDGTQSVSVNLQYACQHWASHLSRSLHNEPTLCAAVEAFFSQHVLFWLKVLSFLGRLEIVDACIQLAKAWLSISHPLNTHTLELVADAERFILSFYYVIEHRPLLIHTSLAFTPRTCLLRESRESSWPRPTVQMLGGLYGWGLLRTFRGHKGWVGSVAFSPDGSRIASASEDKTVCIWNATTGASMNVLEGHQEGISSVVFSPDGTCIASASNDGTVHIWNAKTGAPLNVLQGHLGLVLSVVFSPDGTCVASASFDKTVRIWNAATGAELNAFEGHHNCVYSAVFSPDSRCVASASDDRTILIWNAMTGAKIKKLIGHQDSVMSVTFSPDGIRLASASYDKTIRIWDVTTGTSLKVLKGHRNGVWSIAFSPDGTRIASASYDMTVRVWHATTGTELVALRGHLDRVASVAFSPDGTRIASASRDKTVRIWDATTGADVSTQNGHQSRVTSLAFAHDGTRVRSVSSDPDTVRIWDTATGVMLPHDDDGTIFPTQAPTAGQRYRLEGEWVLNDRNEQICWVPDRYRGLCQACHGEILVIGTEGGSVVIVNFAAIDAPTPIRHED